MGFLYIIRFENGKSYIGITSGTIKRRQTLHLSHARKGRNCALHKAIRKYGENQCNLTPLVQSNDWDYLCDLECRAIIRFNTKYPNGYNLTDGGEGVVGVKRNEEYRKKLSEARKGKLLGNKHTLGYRHTDEAKKKIAAAHTGVIFSDERRKKIGATKIGNKNCLGRVVSEDEKRRISKAQKGKPKFSDEQKALMSLKRKGRPWTNARRAAAIRTKNA